LPFVTRRSDMENYKSFPSFSHGKFPFALLQAENSRFHAKRKESLRMFAFHLSIWENGSPFAEGKGTESISFSAADAAAVKEYAKGAESSITIMFA